MSREIILHHVNKNQNLNDLIEDFYPEFCNVEKKNAISDAIRGMNEHNGNIGGNNLPLHSWVILPAYSSSVYNYIVDQKEPSPGVCSVMATMPIFGIPHVTSSQSALHQGIKMFGPQKMLATTNLTFDWWHEFHGNLAESPQKDTLLESSKYIIEKGGEHGAAIYMATRSLDNALKKFSSAASKEARLSAKQEVMTAHKEVQKELPKSIKKLVTHFANKKFTKASNRRGLKAVANAGNAMHSATKLAGAETLVIGGAEYTKMLKVMRYGQHVGKGFIALDIATNSYDVVSAYEAGQDWKELAFEDSAGLTFSSGLGWLGEITGDASIAVCGPCAVVFAPSLAISGAILGEKIGKVFGKWVYAIKYE